MRRAPVISVVMPAYNAERYIGEAARGILAQTMGDWELLVRDDASADGTARAAESFDDPRIRLLARRDHVGAAQARNEAIGEAQGKYIALHDADDISVAERFEKQARFLDENPDIAMVGSAATIISGRGRQKGILQPERGRERIRQRAFEHGNPYVHPSIMIRKDALVEAGGYDARFRAAHDYDMILRVLERFDGENLDEPLYLFRRHAGALSFRQMFRQSAYADLARVMSAARRRGEDPEAGELGEGFAARFYEIEAGEFTPEFKGRVCRQRARWLMEHGMPWRGARTAWRGIITQGVNRDNLYILRKALMACVGLGGKA